MGNLLPITLQFLTIIVARSGTQKFLEAFKEKKVELIGQFGVGFYSVFMVAQKVADSSWCVKLQNKALQTS